MLYVYMYMYIYTHIYIYIYLYTCVYTYICTHIYKYIYIYIYMYTHMYTHLRSVCITHIYICIYVCICTDVHTFACNCIVIYYIHIYIYKLNTSARTRRGISPPPLAPPSPLGHWPLGGTRDGLSRKFEAPAYTEKGRKL